MGEGSGQRLGDITLHADCDVLQADGGTRTAAVTGGFVALVLALARLREQGKLPRVPVTNYVEDSQCDTDMNVVMTGSGGLVEVQGTAEGAPFSRAEMNAMLDLAEKGIRELIAAKKAALEKP